MVYLGRYLYRGVIQGRDIIGCENGQVTYRWRDSKTKKVALRTVSGATFLWLVLQHVLPKGFRRSRNYGFLHANSLRLIALLKLLVFKLAPSIASTPTPRPQLLCTCCGSPMVITGDVSCRLRFTTPVVTHHNNRSWRFKYKLQRDHLRASAPSGVWWWRSLKNRRKQRAGSTRLSPVWQSALAMGVWVIAAHGLCSARAPS